jgi:hypothetical protein
MPPLAVTKKTPRARQSSLDKADWVDGMVA